MDRNVRTEIDAVRPRWAWRRAISTVSIVSFLVAASACDATAVPPRSLEPLEPLDSEVVESAPTSSGRGSGTSAPGSESTESSESSESSRVASMAPDVSAALVVASAELIEHCVDLVQVGAFLGDTELVTWWDDVDRDEAALRDTCREVAVNDPWHLEQLSGEWRQMESLLLALVDHDGESASNADVTGP